MCTRMLGLAIAAAALFLIAAPTTDAAKLALPEAGKHLLDEIAAACPECMESGFVLCGGRDIRYGTRWADQIFQGQPSRAYLISFVMSADSFRQRARQSTLQATLDTLSEAFAPARLLIIEQDYAAARVLPAAADIEVVFPEPLHQCLSDPAELPWGCCVADCQNECCEKGLGSPGVTSTWHDPVDGERLRFRYSHTWGAAAVTRQTDSGREVYFCFTDQPSFLE